VSFEAAVYKIDSSDALNLFAHSDTFSAKYALAGISFYRRARSIKSVFFSFAPVSFMAYSHFMGKILKLAIEISFAIKAIFRMVCQQKLNNGFTGSSDTG
jgi:tRNA(His) 5'-end guanylyltransferase